ncbi:DinB family protein [Pedobacter cryoconitis]|uniref:Putative damage-inducible protein DinB n=1 Tax=Pedobacter cryoconitis TaxID=188932 RepID=A0A7X0IZK8_9SPHI|nr:DinB family protein [Pedobacter cryoconitis]MBB6498336.1 putative damage-inducible protein DinB [Pedobacter cryoconitis]
MKDKYRTGAKGALLDEYEKAIAELIDCIASVSDKNLIAVVDETTTDPDCKSIQAILAHVVRSAYSYAIYIEHLKGGSSVRPEKQYYSLADEYIKDLNEAFEFTQGVFNEIKNNELEEFDSAKKISTAWGQCYDIEQLMEHAIVHILRHRRQIEKFKILLEN